MGLDSLNTVDVVMQIFLLYYACLCVCVHACMCVYMNYDNSMHIINTLILQVLTHWHTSFLNMAY